MEAKETVMDDREKLVHSLLGKYSFAAVRDVIDEECLAQAEISFKAGYEQGGLGSYATDFAEGKRTGIKEVVECVVYTQMTGEVKVGELFERTKSGQAKLKEWGVDD